MLTRSPNATDHHLALTVMRAVAPLVLIAAPTLVSAESPPPDERPYSITEERVPCERYEPHRRPLFGDLHVHTARSQDASTQGTRVTPREAYQFARGEALGIQPHGEDGRPLRTVQLARPLDFTAITDHSEQLGEVHICNTPSSDGYGSLACRLYRTFPRVAFFVFNGRYSLLGSRWGFCGPDAALCYDAAGVVWDEHRSAAEEAYDRSDACQFTSLVAYEWTAGPRGGAHLHRNVIFRNDQVPPIPVSVMETGPRAAELWRQLDTACRDGVPGCEAITIPHNTNWSAGTAFGSGEVIGEDIGVDEAPLRARYDRLVEMMQHKGESECALYPGVTDEGCTFEKAPNAMGFTGGGLDAIDYARGALKRGLLFDEANGENPLAFGQIGSTDTHLGTPGLVAERGHPGHGGAGKPGNTVLEAPGLADLAELNPGGLAVVWAEENSRDAIFAAMQRRETYATSGTRPTLRLFAGWDFPDAICDEPDVAAAGYASGVPMGGVLPSRPSESSAPTLVVSAARDPHENGGDLERIEIVKGWVEDGEAREAVFTVVGGDRATDVDLATCQTRGSAYKTLCQAWRDPDFAPEQRAFYYARLREAPSCRWTQWACVDAGVTCEGETPSAAGYEACCTEATARTIQERAWSSPVWYRP